MATQLTNSPQSRHGATPPTATNAYGELKAPGKNGQGVVHYIEGSRRDGLRTHPFATTSVTPR